MNIVRLSLASVFILAAFVGSGQCPVSVNDLRNGTANGTPVGGVYNCPGPTVLAASGSTSFPNAITYTGDLTITNISTATFNANFTWNSGTLNIQGAPGSISVASTSVFRINGGSVIANDASSGQLTVNGTLIIADNASYTTWLNITVNGQMNVEGSLLSNNGRMIINSGATVTIAGDGDITTNSSGDTQVAGSLILTNTATLNTNGDLEISGTVSLQDNADIDIGTDLFVFNGGSITISETAVADVAGNVSNVSDNFTPAGGSILVDGTLNVGGDVVIVNTGPDVPGESSLLGEGEIVVGDDFTDNECPTYPEGSSTFCGCTGNNNSGAGIPCSSVLPIELLAFSGIQKGNVIQLKWQTATETNNHFFTIERLLNSDSFEQLLNIESRGTSLVDTNYEAIDHNPLDGKNYYRLRQTDYDGTSTVSHLIVVDFVKKDIAVRIYPNPTRDNKFHIDVRGLESKKEIPITLKTTQGAIVIAFTVPTDSLGNLQTKIEAPVRGLYLLDVAGKVAKIIAH